MRKTRPTCTLASSLLLSTHSLLQPPSLPLLLRTPTTQLPALVSQPLWCCSTRLQHNSHLHPHLHLTSSPLHGASSASSSSTSDCSSPPSTSLNALSLGVSHALCCLVLHWRQIHLSLYSLLLCCSLHQVEQEWCQSGGVGKSAGGCTQAIGIRSRREWCRHNMSRKQLVGITRQMVQVK